MLDFIGMVITAALMVLVVNALTTFIDVSRAAKITLAAVIGVWIGGGGPEGSPTATPEQIAPLYWDLHENRDRPEAVFSA